MLLTALALVLLVTAAVSRRYRKPLIVLAAIILLYAFWRAVTSTGFLVGLFFIAGSIAVAGGILYGVVNLLARMKRPGSTGPARIESSRKGILGKVGVAVTPLRPTGSADIAGTRVSVSTEGEYIAAGSYVRVMAKDRKRYFVRLAEPSEVVESVVRPGNA